VEFSGKREKKLEGIPIGLHRVRAASLNVGKVLIEELADEL
jgi:hypothetical protein